MRVEFESIYRQYRQGLFTLALSITRCADEAEDAVQEAFARLCRSRPPLSGDPTPYAFRAVRNAAVDTKRKSGRRDAAMASIFNGHQYKTADNKDPAQHALESERAESLRRAIDALPDPQREIVVMKAFGHLTFDQIAATLDEPINTVASRYRRALGRLRETMAESR